MESDYRRLFFSVIDIFLNDVISFLFKKYGVCDFRNDVISCELYMFDEDFLNDISLSRSYEDWIIVVLLSYFFNVDALDVKLRSNMYFDV